MPKWLDAAFIGGIGGLIVAFITGYFSVQSSIDNLIKEKLNNTDFIKKLIENMRHVIVFDQNERIISDIGDMQHIEKIKVEGELMDLSVGQVKVPNEIIIYPKKLLSVTPLLESLDQSYEITAEKGEMLV